MVYVDFLPDPTGNYDGQYDSFRSLIDRANNWLQRNTNMEAITCETISVRTQAQSSNFNTELMITPGYHVQNTVNNHRFQKEPELHGLRLWYLGHEEVKEEAARPENPTADKKGKKRKKKKKKKKADEEEIKEEEAVFYEPQKIGYTTLIPRKISGAGIDGDYFNSLKKSEDVFEPLAATISRHNSELKRDPLKGHILNIQTIRLSYNKETGPGDPEETYHQLDDTEIQAVRIYYNHGQHYRLREKVGFADFIPSQNGQETFSNIFSLADEWLHMQNNLRVCHIQAIYCNKEPAKRQYVDTQKALIHIPFGQQLIRAVRVWYLRPHEDEKVRFPKVPAFRYRTFEPIMKQIRQEYKKKDPKKKKKVKEVKIDVMPLESMMLVIKRAVLDLKDQKIGILCVETDTAYVSNTGTGTCEVMKVQTDMKQKRAVRFYTFDVPESVLLSPRQRRKLGENEPSQACVIL